MCGVHPVSPVLPGRVPKFSPSCVPGVEWVSVRDGTGRGTQGKGRGRSLPTNLTRKGPEPPGSPVRPRQILLSSRGPLDPDLTLFLRFPSPGVDWGPPFPRYPFRSSILFGLFGDGGSWTSGDSDPEDFPFTSVLVL